MRPHPAPAQGRHRLAAASPTSSMSARYKPAGQPGRTSPRTTPRSGRSLRSPRRCGKSWRRTEFGSASISRARSPPSCSATSTLGFREQLAAGSLEAVQRITADDVADTICYLATLDPSVAVNELVVRFARQAFYQARRSISISSAIQIGGLGVVDEASLVVDEGLGGGTTTLTGSAQPPVRPGCRTTLPATPSKASRCAADVVRSASFNLLRLVMALGVAPDR